MLTRLCQACLVGEVFSGVFVAARYLVSYVLAMEFECTQHTLVIEDDFARFALPLGTVVHWTECLLTSGEAPARRWKRHTHTHEWNTRMSVGNIDRDGLTQTKRQWTVASLLTHDVPCQSYRKLACSCGAVRHQVLSAGLSPEGLVCTAAEVLHAGGEAVAGCEAVMHLMDAAYELEPDVRAGVYEVDRDGTVSVSPQSD